MGKNFRKELAEISSSYVAVLNQDVSVIKEFLNNTDECPILLIGSGGSFSVAETAAYMLRRAGLFSKAITPIELPQYEKQLAKFSAILFTAGGRNSDTQNSYQYLSELETHAVLTMCMSQNAPIAKKQQADLHTMYFDFSIPCGKDGYLAVNSTIASIALLSKALFELSHDSFFYLPEQIQHNLKNSLDDNKLLNLINKETIIVLHGGITTPVAYDLESKFSEVALGNIQLVDFRNFAHGRHYWVSTRGDRTAILMLTGEEESVLAEKTKQILSDQVFCESFVVDHDNIGGLLELYIDIFELVASVGERNGLDPGRPQVAAFGRKLYHLSSNPCTTPDHRKIRRSAIYVGAKRKAKSGNYIDFTSYLTAAETYFLKLQQKQFQGIIFDYDGTLHEKNKQSYVLEDKIFEIINRLLCAGIKIGIATGRGKSVRQELQNKIREEYWCAVAIGYYNGGCIASLSDNAQPNINLNVPHELQLVKEAFDGFHKDSSIQTELRPTQLTVTSTNAHKLKAYVELCRERLCHVDGIKLVESSHSIDVLLNATTKSDILKFFEKGSVVSNENFLFVGDCGQYGGNDYEMLSLPYSLSVDLVSQATNSCWNFAPPGTRNVAATLHYLEHIILSEENTSFSIALL